MCFMQKNILKTRIFEKHLKQMNATKKQYFSPQLEVFFYIVIVMSGISFKANRLKTKTENEMLSFASG